MATQTPLWQVEPLGQWTRPVTQPRVSSARFRASSTGRFAATACCGPTRGSTSRVAARTLHPDTGGDPAMWALLDEARQLMETGGLL